jgi:hypothetical protein
VDESVFDYTSEFLLKPIPVAQLEEVAVPQTEPFPMSVFMYRWAPHDVTISVRVTQDRWIMRRDDAVLTPTDRNLIRRQNNHIHRVNFDGIISFYKFSGSFQQLTQDRYNIQYEWISDPGVRDLDKHAQQQIGISAFGLKAWPGKMPSGGGPPVPPYKIPFPDDPSGTLWAIPPFFEALPISHISIPELVDPDDVPPVFPRVLGYDIDLDGWMGLPHRP